MSSAFILACASLSILNMDISFISLSGGREGGREGAHALAREFRAVWQSMSAPRVELPASGTPRRHHSRAESLAREPSHVKYLSSSGVAIFVVALVVSVAILVVATIVYLLLI